MLTLFSCPVLGEFFHPSVTLTGWSSSHAGTSSERPVDTPWLELSTRPHTIAVSTESLMK